MMPPRLNRRMILAAPERSPDGAGGHVVTWVARGTLWAAVAPGAGREAAGAGATLSRVALRITLRAAPPGSPARPAPGMRLTEGARRFDILAVTEADPAGRYLTCIAEEEVAR